MTQGIRGYRFGDFTLDLDTARLQRAGAEPVALRRLVLRVLTLLLENAPNLVSRDRLLEHAWERQVVSDGVVSQVIKELRQLLGDNAQQPRYLETRPRQGYRILLPAEAILRAPAEAVDTPLPGSRASASVAAMPGAAAENVPAVLARRRWAWQPATALLAILLAGLALIWRPQPASDPALTADALRMDWHRLVDRAPAELSPADARVAADALLARGDMAAVHALVAAQRPQARDAWERGLLDLIALRADGREHDALARVEALLALRPDDLPLRLLRAELEVAWRAPSRRAPPVTDPALPPERQLLQQARAAGAAGDAQAQQQHARAAIELAGERSPVLRELARIELGLALARMGDSESADGAFARAQAALAEAGFHRLALAALLQRSALARRTGRATQVLPALEAEDARVAERGDVAMRAELTRHRGILVGIGGDFATSLALLESAAAMFVELGDHARASSALNASSGPLGRLGRNAEVPARLAEAQRHAALSQHPESAAAIAGNLGLFHWRRGEIGAATAGMREALAQFERADRADDVAQARNNLATLLREAGEVVQALPMRELAVAHARQAALRADLATRLYGLAEDLRARGDTPAALGALDESEALYREIADPVSLQAIACLRGLWALEGDRVDEAQRALPATPPAARPTADQAACDTLAVRVLAREGRAADALARVDERLGALDQAGQRLLAQQARLLRAELLIDLDRADAARAELEALRAQSLQDGHVALERGIALAWLRLTRGEQAARALAQEAADTLLRRHPDQPAQLRMVCLVAATAGTAAREDCRDRAAALDLAGIAREALAEATPQ